MEKKQYEKMMNQQLNIAIAGYSGILDSRVEILYNILDFILIPLECAILD